MEISGDMAVPTSELPVQVAQKTSHMFSAVHNNPESCCITQSEKRHQYITFLLKKTNTKNYQLIAPLFLVLFSGKCYA